MSRYLSGKLSALTPYTPGEQPQDMAYVKLNTNESPFPPFDDVMAAVRDRTRSLNLYPDPECRELRQALAAAENVRPEQIILSNGSDDMLNFAVTAFCDEDTPLAFADITYGFYSVFAALNRVPVKIIPLKDDLTLDPADYRDLKATIFIANPNAPTGIALPPAAIEEVLASNPGNVVLVDEAYVDFGGESCVPLIRKYPNLLVARTFSKSRSMAGARLGYGIACEELIGDLNTIRCSTNPYNINSMTAAAAIAMLAHDSENRARLRQIMKNRAWTVKEMEKLGFTVLPSQANFIFARHEKLGGEALYRALKARGVLVRHFTAERIRDYNRITIGSMEQMQTLTDTVRRILTEEANGTN